MRFCFNWWRFRCSARRRFRRAGGDPRPNRSRRAVDFKAAVAPLLEKYCVDCHSGKEPKGDLSLEFADRGQVEQRLSSDHKLFEKMADRLAAGKMPPPKKAQAHRRGTGSSVDVDLPRSAGGLCGHARAGPGGAGAAAEQGRNTPTPFAICSISRSSKPMICRRMTWGMALTTSPTC